MIRFIENIGDYFSQHFFNEDFPKKVFEKAGYSIRKKDKDSNTSPNHVSEFNKRVTPLRQKYDRFKNNFLSIRRTKDRVKLTHDFHTEVLKVLGYTDGHPEYQYPVYLNEDEVIPVRYQFRKGGKPHLFVMEMQAIIQEGDHEPDGVYEQVYIMEDWEKVFPSDWREITLKPDVIDEALSALFLLDQDDRPEYVILLAGRKVFLIHYEKWKYDSFLLFDLEDLFIESQVPANRDYLSLFYALLSKKQFISDTNSLLDGLEEDAHKAAYGVTQTLKNGVIYAVENLANEAIWYKLNKEAGSRSQKDAVEALMSSPEFSRELKDECLTLVYRLLFLFYAEAREDLEILPVKDSVYQKGYSLEMLRDLEMVPLTTDSSRNGYFFSESLWKLFAFLYQGLQNEGGFTMKPLDSPLFNNKTLKHLSGVNFRNSVLQEIILRLSLSERTKRKGRGRISYANLGINQLGSVYESLLAYSGFFAAEPLIEVKSAKDKTGKDGTFLVPKARRDEFEEDEILKDKEHPERDVEIEKGKFVYRLNGRDRKKSASYYTPEVLTQCTVKYTLKNILEPLRERQDKGEEVADEVLKLKILEPAMGAAAFHNEVINQLAVSYLELKENEVVRKKGHRIIPGQYNEELQKVKAFIAANNVYGVDLNPTAVELGKLSLWLNCMHKDMETPFFAHRLGVGNAVVGAWLKVYKAEEVLIKYVGNSGKKWEKKEWWNKAPKRVKWNKNGKLNRKEDEIYHFLLPDANMIPSAGIKLLKAELSKGQWDKFKNWKKEFCKPLGKAELVRLKKICHVIDHLLDEHFKQVASINKNTASHYQLYGQSTLELQLKGYGEKEQLARARENRRAPYFKLKTIMDYWCSLWFWDIRQIPELPTRTQWYNEIENILGIILENLSEIPQSLDFQRAIQKQGKDITQMFETNRLGIVQKASKAYRFFHNELEFIEVFREREGFDVIVGNPPWVTVSLDKMGIFAEFDPIIYTEGWSSSKIDEARDQIFMDFPHFKEVLIEEEIFVTSLKMISKSNTCFPLNQSSKSNLHKLILESSIYISHGSIGMLVDKGLFDDPNGGAFRSKLYPKLKFLFRFINELMLFDIGHAKKFELLILSCLKKREVSFESIANLYHPKTIEFCFQNFEEFGIGIKDESNAWELRGNKNRIMKIDDSVLSSIYSLFGNKSGDFGEIKLPLIHSKKIYNVLKKFAQIPLRLRDLKGQYFGTQMLNETNAQRSGIIKRKVGFVKDHEFILSGPHFYVCTPYNKNPNENCSSKGDYSKIDLLNISENYLPRTIFRPASSKEESFLPPKYYHIHRRRAVNTNERTLIPCIQPPHRIHTYGGFSLHFDDEWEMLLFSSVSSSILADFLIRISGKEDLLLATVEILPFLPRLDNRIIHRYLRLNCVTIEYATLWDKYRSRLPSGDSLEDRYGLIKPRVELEAWTWTTPYRSEYERRIAQIEIDVLLAISIGLKPMDLLEIFEIQFPVLKNNESKLEYCFHNGVCEFDRSKDYVHSWTRFEGNLPKKVD